MTHFINNFLFRLAINVPFIKLINRNRKLGLEKSSSNCISGGVGFEYQFFVKDMGLSFPTNLLISCNLKTHLSEVEDKESESDFSGKKK